MIIELITTGSELLSGRTVSTHAAFVGQRLARLGLHLARDTTVPDDKACLHAVFEETLMRSDVLLVSGGLGPTADDITRDVLAPILGQRIVLDPLTCADLRERYPAKPPAFMEQLERHSLVLEHAQVLTNAVGLAPGERIAHEQKTIFLLPGPPSEFEAVFDQHVGPWLQEHVAVLDHGVERVLMLAGIGESEILRRLAERGWSDHPYMDGTCAALGRVEIRFRAAAEEADQLAETIEQFDRLFEPHVYAHERLELAEMLAKVLCDASMHVSVAESCTSGLLAAALTHYPGSSSFFRGGVVAYANDVKIEQLGVDPQIMEAHGAVSAQTAMAMAQGAQTRFKTDVALSITGLAGPGGATSDKPLGQVFIGLCHSGTTDAKAYHFRGNRTRVRQASVASALERLRVCLWEQGLMR